MKDALIKEVQPLIKDFWLNRDDKSIINEMTVKFYEERIRTLPKQNVLELYEKLQELKKAKSQEAKEYLYVWLITNITLLYSFDGRFLKKLFSIRNK